MGCDCHIELPANVRISDVQSVLGALLGFPKEVRVFNKNKDWYTYVNGVKEKSTSHPSLWMLSWDDAPGIKNKGSIFFHFEYKAGTARLLAFSSTDENLAIACALVDFFGGNVDFNDCDDVTYDYHKTKGSNKRNCPSDGKPWVTFQKRIMKIEPLKETDVNRYKGKSVYGRFPVISP